MTNMNRKTIITSLLLCFCAVAMAQPRAAGLRFGATGIEASYQHSLDKNTFIQGELGMDFGSSVDAGCGVKATGTYNIIWARPAWTDKGTWAIYAGPGATLGYTGDSIIYRDELATYKTRDHGFMFAVGVQAGLEYNFEVPLQLAVDLRPFFGVHVSQQTGFYNRGMLGFVPTISARYRF